MIIRDDDILLSRAEEFENLGVIGMDAIHIACTEKAGAVLLTTDDDLVKIMKNNTLITSIHADNPLQWLMEMNQHGE
ncbi:MAG: hypothetical protein NTV68_09585 [Methanomicrobiales archaeon]|nr:hypothetical protein [Methanomicrobiales archaeon]